MKPWVLALVIAGFPASFTACGTVERPLTERVDLDRELNNWIRQYVADMDNPMPGVRSRRPLRQAKVTVEDVAGEPGWYRVGLQVRPHFKYMGAFFTLSLVGKLDKE